jgi:hypothetical protein
MVSQDDFMPNCSTSIKPHKLHHSYSQAVQAPAVRTYVLGADSSCFISAIIGKETFDPLEYCQLIKIPKYWDIWTCSFANELERLFQGICKHKGTDTCFFIKKSDAPKGRTYTYGQLFATTILRRMNHTGLGSPWVVIALTTLVTRARQQPISPL